MSKKKQSLTKIIKEASEQSQRNKQPNLTTVMTMSELITISKDYDKKIFPYEEEAKITDFQSFDDIVSQIKKDEKILVCIGPEGGLSEREVALLKEHNFLAVLIGHRILRT